MTVDDRRLPARSLRASLEAARRAADLRPDPGSDDGKRAEPAAAWRDAARAAGLGEGAVPKSAAAGDGDEPWEPAFEGRPPGPEPRHRAPPPVGPPRPRAVDAALDGVPDRVLVLPARTGRLAEALLDLGAREVLAHEPDPRLRERLAARAEGRAGLEVRPEPATELAYHQRVDAAVADRPLYAARSLVGLLGRLHHALAREGDLVLVDVLEDEAQDPRTPTNRTARALRVQLRARGRDLVALQDLWRLLIETGFQEVWSRRDPPTRRVVRARR